MVTQDQKQFTTYVLSRLLPQLALTRQDQAGFIGDIATVIPELNEQDAVKAKEFKVGMWDEKISRAIVEHYAGEYEPGKLRATA
jgi:hypothetical protein